MPGFNLSKSDKTIGSNNSKNEFVRSHRFKLLMYGVPAQLSTITGTSSGTIINILKDSCLSVQRPTRSADQLTQHLGQFEVYYPGKIKFQAIDIKFYDAYITNDMSIYQFMNIWQSMSMQKFDFSVVMDGGVVDGSTKYSSSYSVFGAWPTDVKGSELNYSNGDISTCDVTFRFDYASQYTGKILSNAASNIINKSWNMGE